MVYVGLEISLCIGILVELFIYESPDKFPAR